jgi:tRNA threonylcarbamoyl adenosine modification protein YjeE
MTSASDDPGRTGNTVVALVEDEAALPVLAGRLAAALPPAAFVALEGDLGAGKTTFVKAVAAAAGIDPADVVSPTFGLIHEHGAVRGSTTGPRLVHADMYRLPAATELQETGWDDAIAAPGWVFVEWPGRIADALPADRLDVSISIDGPHSRTFTFVSRGPGHDSVVAALCAATR